MFVLDTDTCIYLLNQRYPRLTERVLSHRASDLAISVVTAAELQYGVDCSVRREPNQRKLDVFRSEIEMLPFDEKAIRAYGRVRAILRRRGAPIGPLDTLIAAHALSLGRTLVTNNIGEFGRIPGLACENWAG